MRLIGFAGQMGSGKDAAVKFLEPYGFTRRAFADKLRVEVYEALESGYVPDAMPEHIRASLYKCLMRDVFEKPTPDPARIVLQWWGAWRRSQNPYYWIVPLFADLEPQGVYAFSDVRYANEAWAIQRCGGLIVKITGRAGTGGIADHESERIDFPCDLEIRNDLTLEAFRQRVIQAVLDSRASASKASSSVAP